MGEGGGRGMGIIGGGGRGVDGEGEGRGGMMEVCWGRGGEWMDV
jgi:hypothetical protein